MPSEIIRKILLGSSQPVLLLALQNCKNHRRECAPWVLGPSGGTTAPRLKTSMFWLLLVHSSFVLVPVSSVDWRAKKGQFEVMTGRTWPNPESSNRAKYTREYVLREFLADLCGGQTRPQRGHTDACRCTIKIRVLLRLWQWWTKLKDGIKKKNG